MSKLHQMILLQLPWYYYELEHSRKCTKQEVELRDPDCVDGFWTTTMTCEPRIYLPWITKKCVSYHNIFADTGKAVSIAW